MQLKTSKLHFICHKNKLEAEDRKDRKWRKSDSVDFQWGYPLGRKKPLLKPLPPSRVACRSVADSPSGHHHNGSVSRDSVPVRSCVSLPPRPHGVPRRLYGQAGFHNGSVSRDPVPVRQTGREEEIASRALASHAQPFCNVQHITKIHPTYYQKHTF